MFQKDNTDSNIEDMLERRIIRAKEISHEASPGVQWQWEFRLSCEGHQGSLCCGIQWSILSLLLIQCISSI